MSFFHVTNLTQRVLKNEILPWNFELVNEIPESVRTSKEARQVWYHTPDTQHHFYTAVQPANENIRPSKENPARMLHGIVADYDVVIPDARIDEAVGDMKIKPAWIERSLGGHSRLVWVFPRPLMVDDNQFAGALLSASEKWLSLQSLPGLDAPALRDPMRLYCNGASWRETGAGPIQETALQAFFVEVGQAHRFNGAETSIPLDIVEKELHAKYPGFSWPGEFALESKGPSWWIADSVSPMSAIVKPEGMFTFSAHAAKPFYSWADILGPEFVRQFSEEVISKATQNIWYDGKMFWRRKNGYYASAGMAEMMNYFKVECRLSTKPDKTGCSPTDVALNHIYTQCHIAGAAPFVHRPSGIIHFLGKRTLNTYESKLTQPATTDGDTSFLDLQWDNLFDPPEQKFYCWAWIKHNYEHALAGEPMPGQNIFMMGGADTGKTMTAREIIGKGIFGGFADASGYLINGSAFNSELFEVPIWCLDDETTGESLMRQLRVSAIMKKLTANGQFMHSKKFEIPVMIEWFGRIIATTNTDHISSRLLGPMDITNMDKTNLFRCSAIPKIVFPQRYEITRLVAVQTPFWLRRLLKWNPPDFVVPDVRFGFRAYHEPLLLEQSHQTSRVAPFKELMIESLTAYFKDNPKATEWRGTVTQFMRLLMSNPITESIMRSLKLDQCNRHLEQVQRENLFHCKSVKGPMNTRIWVFERFGDEETKPAPPIPEQPVVSIFNK